MADLPDDLALERDRWRRIERMRPERIVFPRPGQESVWDYPRPPRVEAVEESLRVELGERVLAETRSGLRVLETASPPVYYFPPGDVSRDLLEPGPARTFCEWKGVASYWSARVGKRRVPDVAFCYAAPEDGFEAIRDHLAFFASRVDACFVGSERARPQPGGYYAGWLTSAIVGPFKGEPGTERW